MKKYLFIILAVIVLLIIIILLFVLKNKNNKKEINSIKELEYKVNDGRNIYGDIIYNLKCDDKCILSSKLDGYNDDEFFEVEISNDDYNKILKILRDYNVGSWDGFKKSDKHVLDGKSYTFEVVTKDNQRIYASGYMAYPKNYNVVIEKLKEIFDKANDSLCIDLFSHDKYKGFDIKNVSKVIEEFYGEGGLEKTEYDSNEKIMEIYNKYKDLKIGIETKSACEDNTVIYRFIMNDGKEYTIENECDWIVLDNKNYVTFYK